MSEKRFTLMENISAYDGRVISEYVLDNEKRLTFEEVVDLLNSLVDENEQLRQTMQKVCKLLEEEVDLFSEKATEHDIIAYREMQEFDNKDAYYICTATKKAIQMLKR